jgi:hypothetical protein
MIVAPSTSPTLVKRRLTPSNRSKPARSSSSDAELERDRDRGQRVLDIVPARHRQWMPSIVRRSPSRSRIDASNRLPPGTGVDIVGAHVGQRGEAVGDDAPVADAADDVLHLGMVGAHHGEAVERHVLDELDERVLDRVEVP